MDQIGVKRLTTLFLVFIFGILSMLSFFYDRAIPTEFTTATMMVVAFYFKKE
jgi:hypothetical protein